MTHPTPAFADDATAASEPADALSDATSPEPDSFHRWVNRRWPNRESSEPEAAGA